jgi:hypothetical protein
MIIFRQHGFDLFGADWLRQALAGFFQQQSQAAVLIQKVALEIVSLSFYRKQGFIQGRLIGLGSVQFFYILF